EVEMYKLGSQDRLWSRKLSSYHRLYWNAKENLLLIQWALDSDAAKTLIKNDSKLDQLVRSMKDKDDDVLLEVLDLDTGNRLNTLIIDTGKGSFQIRDVVATRAYVAVGVTNNRTLIYSLATGQIQGRLFGDSPALYAKPDTLRVRTDRNTMALYDLPSMQLKTEHKLTRQLIAATPSADGTQMIVLTSDQSVLQL